MQINVAKSAGFCSGVQKAVKGALNFKGENLYTLGDIIHSNYLDEIFLNKNIKKVDTLSEIEKIKGDKTILIRTHGEPKSTFDFLTKNNIKYIDSTCVFVKKIQNKVTEYFQKGYEIIIIGNKKHPEIIGINGWCENKGTIIENIEDAEKLDYKAFNNKKVFCVVQTTFNNTIYNNIYNILKNNIYNIEFFNSICYTTICRQKEAVELAKANDIILVIGSRKSSNTRKLFDIAKKYCKKTFFISNLSDLKSVRTNMENRIGVLSGASTPKELIEEVISRMSESQKDLSVKTVEEKKQDALKNEKGTVEKEKKNKATKVEQTENFEKLFEKYAPTGERIKVGKRFKHAQVISANEEGLFVKLSNKAIRDAFVPAEEVELSGVKYDPNNYPQGTEIEVAVIEVGKAGLRASKKQMDVFAILAEKVQKIIEDGEEFEVTIKKTTKGGLIGYLFDDEQIGIKVFIPASQVRFSFVDNEELKKYVGKKLKLVYLPDKKQQNEDNAETKKKVNYSRIKNIKASRRAVLEKALVEKNNKFWTTVREGRVVTGKVKKLVDFGAFVNIEGFDCLVYLSNLAWYRIKHPSEILEVGKTYDFIVLETNEAEARESGNPRFKKQVSLGYKQLQKHPYEFAREKYLVGQAYKGRVARLESFGAFIEFYQFDENGELILDAEEKPKIEPGIDGLMPIAEISYEWVDDINKVLTIGQEVDFKVIKFDEEENKITVSAKALMKKEKDDDLIDPEDFVEQLSEDEIKKYKQQRRKENMSKFEYDPSNYGSKPRQKKAEKEEEEIVTSYTSEDKNVAPKLGDLFKDFKFPVEDEK